MRRFKVVVCAKCGAAQATESEKELKCRRCGKSTVFKKLKVLRTFDTGRQAALFIQEYTKLKWKQKK
jgi:ribosomal protein L40E